MMKTIFSFIGGIIVGLIVVWVWNVFTPTISSTATPQKIYPDNLPALYIDDIENPKTTDIADGDIQVTAKSQNIKINNQKAGNSVFIESIMKNENGWIAVHEEKNGFISNALGVAHGGKEQGDITVNLLRNTEPEKRYWIVLYNDNGDHQFSLTDDFPIRDELNNPIIKSFIAK